MTGSGAFSRVERSEWKVLSDVDVVRRVLAGETALFEALMRRYNQRLYRVARAILRDDSEAEDVMQHADVQAYAHLGQFAGRSSFATWLTRIAVHEALARLRRRRRDVITHPLAEPGEEVMVRLESDYPNPEQLALQGELSALLESSIEDLPLAYRSVLVLRDVEGLSTAETADSLEITEDAVKTRLHRARALLREELFERAGIAAATAFSFHLSRCDRIVAAVFQRLDHGRMSTIH